MKICDVIDNCEECPRYGDDCDGRSDAEVNETKSPYMQQSRHDDGTDLISRADAIEAVCKAVCEDDVPIFLECDQIKYCDEIQALLALPSADAVQEAVPTVVRVTMSDGSQYYLEHERDAIQADAEQTELPQYAEWQDSFDKMCESAKPKTFVADEWYRETFKEND